VDFPFLIPFIHDQGIELLSSGDGESCLQLALRPTQVNQLGIAHGGILMTLLDVTMAQAARAGAPPLRPGEAERSMITIEMKTTFFQPALGLLTARGKVQHATGRMAYTEGTVFDAQGRRCAQAMGTFRFVEPRREPPAFPRTTEPNPP
jgi:uncharacterized protein (TIGR00369 family)